MWQQTINWIEKHLATCTFQKHFGICCPGCGFQSALLYLLKGELIQSMMAYPALIPILSLLLFLLLHLKFKFSRGAIVLKLLFYLSITLILIPYLFKISKLI